jgi:uroporphyrinogen-III synthase
MKIDLCQWQVLVTRPDPAGSRLCHLINEHNGCAYHFPTLSIQPPSNISLLQNGIKKLDQQDWLIFISPQSVYASCERIKAVWPQLPNSLQLAAIGESTKAALLKAGYSSVICPVEWNSEGLLNLAEFQNVEDKKIAIVRGEEGRDYLAKTLQERGAQITHLIAYRRILSSESVEPIFKLIKQKQVDAVICASFQSANNLKQLVGDDHWSELKKIPLVVVSARIKELAGKMGFQTIWVARNASDSEIINVLHELAVMKNGYVE